MSDTSSDEPRRADEPAVEAVLALAFAPVHKVAFGAAVGIVLAGLILAVTVFHLLVQPAPALQLRLLAQYFYGYSVSWKGALIGAFWAGILGFVAGWFLAFLRNLAAATSLFVIRTRAELQQTRDFLDHI